MIFCFCAMAALSAVAQSNQLQVQIDNIRNSEGKILVALYDSESDYLKKFYVGKNVSASKGQMVVTFDNLVPGKYAVSAIHDSNDNGELDTNFFGIPKEGFGFLNGAMGTFGPPKFESVTIQWTGEAMVVVVPMKYF